MRRALAFSFLLCVATAGVDAQEARDPSDLVVRAPGPAAQDIQSRAHDLVRAVTAQTVADQLARHEDSVCLRIMGVAEPTARRVRATIETVATGAGVRMAPLDCDPNVMITFTADASALAAATAERQPRLFRAMPGDERAALLGGSGPLRWWLRHSITSSRGSRPGSTSAALMNSGDYRMNTDAPTTNEYVSTLIRRPTQAVVDGVSILVDVPAARGLPLDALSEYIAFVALAPPRMSESFSAFDSILALRDHAPGGTSQQRLSDWDRAFLASLYAVPADRAASAQRSMIAQAMAARLRER